MGEPRSLRCDLLFKVKQVFPCSFVFAPPVVRHFRKTCSKLMAFPALPLYDAITKRMDALETKLDIIIAALGGEKVSKSAEQDQKPSTFAGEGKGTAQKTSEKVSNDAPQGWTTVARKARKSESKGNVVKQQLRLRPQDWGVGVISFDDLVQGAVGVCDVPDERSGEGLFRLLEGSSEKLALVTTERLEAAGMECKEIDCHYLNVNDR